MRTLAELGLLARETLRFWRRYFPLITACFLFGWTCLNGGAHLSAAIGAKSNLAATLIFIAGATGNVVCTIMMIAVMKPGLAAPRLLDRRGALASSVPNTVFQREPHVDLAIKTIGPFLAVYAVWGLVKQWVNRLFQTNIQANGVDTTTWSVSYASSWFPFYLKLGLTCLALRIVVGFLARRFRTRWLGIPQLLLEGAWAFSAIFVAYMISDAFDGWFFAKAIGRTWLRVRATLAGLIPDIHLPFNLTLPEAVMKAGSWIADTLLPNMWHGLMLPLMWLALTAVVFGWREFSASRILRGRAARLSERLEDERDHSVVRVVADLLTKDLREKYLPVLQSLTLTWRAGPRFLAAFLVLAALIDAVNNLGQVGLTMLMGPMTQADNGAIVFARTLAVQLWFEPLLICLYVAAFDRGVREVIGRVEERSAAALAAPAEPATAPQPPVSFPPPAAPVPGDQGIGGAASLPTPAR